jgi:hypothetical protein
MWGVLRFRDASLPPPLFGLALVAVFYLAALQAFERLLRPERAIGRTAALSGSSRKWLRIVSRAAAVTYYAAFVGGAVLDVAGGEYRRNLALDIGILSTLIVIFGSRLADLKGERLFEPYRPNRPGSV